MKKQLPAQEEIDLGLPDRLLPLAAVKQLSGLGKTMIYQLEREGKFPKRYKPGGVATRWSEREIVEWMEVLKSARR